MEKETFMIIITALPFLKEMLNISLYRYIRRIQIYFITLIDVEENIKQNKHISKKIEKRKFKK